MPVPIPYTMPESSKDDASVDVQRSPRHPLWFALAAIVGFGIGLSILVGFFSLLRRFASDGFHRTSTFISGIDGVITRHIVNLGWSE